MAATIVDAIRDGTFPDDEVALSTTIDGSSIPTLLDEISITKDELSRVVKEISKNEAADVDGWIAQAKKVQEDIARCKEDARHIVEEHGRIEALRAARNDARTKADLLQNEILFNETLQQQIEVISTTSTTLNKADADLRQGQYLVAASALPALATTITALPDGQARELLSSMRSDLMASARNRLMAELDQCFRITNSPACVTVEIINGVRQVQDLSFTELLNSIDLVGALPDAESHMTKQLEASLLAHLHKRSSTKLFGAIEQNSGVQLNLSTSIPRPEQVINALTTLVKYLYQQLPQNVRGAVVSKVAAAMISRLIDHWLDAAIPIELDELRQLDDLRTSLQQFLDQLREADVPEAERLQAWLENVPKAWLDRRRTTSLDSVRRAFKIASRSTRNVERAEKQTMIVDQNAPASNATDSEWSDKWDDDEGSHQTKSHDNADDGSDAWGFDTDEQHTGGSKKDDHADDADAWGWGDDEEATQKPADQQDQSEKVAASSKSNGLKQNTTKEEDVVLTETYTITDIPDYILEQIGKDVSDMRVLQSSPEAYFKSSPHPPSGMQSLPTLVLSMYRAIAPSAYIEPSGSFPALSTMNLYNDALYLSQKLSENTDSATTFRSDIESLNKFARQLYSAELTMQRQILSDLLDNAQGFIGCTREPNSSVCETAVSSTTDYLRNLYRQWSPVLSQSHLSSMMGKLLSSVMGKMTKDIEDMEDISEAESQKLLSFMEQISKLEDLFPVISQPSASASEEGPSSTIAQYVPEYLRFQYLQQILDSSLVDIKYLWTDAGLSLEFSADEVIDLIKALFSESSHRRNAVQAIRSH